MLDSLELVLEVEVVEDEDGDSSPPSIEVVEDEDEDEVEVEEAVEPPVLPVSTSKGKLSKIGYLSSRN